MRKPSPFRPYRLISGAGFLLVLMSCGGGAGGGNPAEAKPSSASQQSPLSTMRLMTRTSTLSSEPEATLLAASAEAQSLPKSQYAVGRGSVNDRWAVSVSNGARSDFVRLSGGHVVDFYARRTPQTLASGGFDLQALAGTDSPEMLYAPRPSPDGAYVIGYWRANYRDSAPTLTVFDRKGNIVSRIPNTEYDANGVADAVDWLPDGRFVFLADNNLVIGSPKQASLDVVPLSWPATVSYKYASIWASPDGKRVLLSLQTKVKNAEGGDVDDMLLYLVDIDGGNFHQVTTVSKRIGDAGISVAHGRATWSSDGQQILFAVDTKVAITSETLPSWAMGCPVVMSVSALAQRQVVDGWYDPDANFYSGVSGGLQSPKGKVNACGPGNLAWVEP